MHKPLSSKDGYAVIHHLSTARAHHMTRRWCAWALAARWVRPISLFGQCIDTLGSVDSPDPVSIYLR